MYIQGLIDAVGKVFPTANHRFCNRHLYANMKKEFRGLVIKDAFWAATRATSKYEFTKAMDALKEVSNDAHDWLDSKPHQQWSRYAYDHTSHCEHRTNNVCESFNSKLGSLRMSTPLTIFDKLREKMMVRLHRRYAKACSMEGPITKDCKKRVQKLLNQSRRCVLLPGRDDNYEVHENEEKYAVNLNTNTCTCNWWKLAGIPCQHALKAISYKRTDPYQYCDPCFSVENYLNTYSGVIYPIPTTDLTCQNISEKVRPPPIKRNPGRPRVQRQGEEDEAPANAKKRSTSRCSLCGTLGHNKRGCEGGAPKKKSKGNKAAKKRNAGEVATTGGQGTKKRGRPKGQTTSKNKKKQKKQPQVVLHS